MTVCKHISGVVNISHPQRVLEEVESILIQISPSIDLTEIRNCFNDAIRLFKGTYPGYLSCNTRYHDLHHTLDALLAMVRLMHGAVNEGYTFSDHNLLLGVICTLFHDSGYMQTVDDNNGTGAKYTTVHIQRSIDFLIKYLSSKSFDIKDNENVPDILNCTGLNTKVADVHFADSQIELLGKMLGTADLLGQMSDRYYLEKLLYLYQEFIEGGITVYASEFELLQKTTVFFDLTEKRFKSELGNVSRFMQSHYSICLNYQFDPYQVAMQKNLSFLEELVQSKQDFISKLKRGKIVKMAVNRAGNNNH